MPLETPEPNTQNTGGRWLQRAGVLLFVMFCFEIGIFLILFPWLELWHNNWLAGWLPGWLPWSNLYFRGALSGVGAINVYIALSEAAHLR